MKQKLSPTQIGSLNIVLAGILVAFLPICYKFIQDISVIWISAIVWALAGIAYTVQCKYKKIHLYQNWKKSENKKDIILAGFLIGAVVHGLIFTGVQYTSAGNASIFVVTEVLFSFLLFHFWKKEKEHTAHIIGAIFMFIGILVLFQTQIRTLSFNIGDILIISGFAIAPLSNAIQQKILKKGEKSPFILVVRSIITVFFFILIGIFTQTPCPSLPELNQNIWPLIILGIGILGVSKIFWLEGIKRISIPRATSISLFIPILTLIAAYPLLGETPSKDQLLALIPMIIGVYLLVIWKSKPQK